MSNKTVTSSLGDFFGKVESIIRSEQDRTGKQHKLNLSNSTQGTKEIELVFDVIDVKTQVIERQVAVTFNRKDESFSSVSYWCEGQI